MLDWMSNHLWLTWLGLATVLAVAELLGGELVLLMLAIAALGASLTSLVAPGWVTLVAFALLAVALLALARPRFLARLHSGPTLTVGHHNLVGRLAVVTEDVTDMAGRVDLEGTLWTARARPGVRLAAGSEVVVSSIDGATAIVAGKES